MDFEISVIGCSNGGVHEVIQNDVNGHLTAQDDSVELTKRIDALK